MRIICIFSCVLKIFSQQNSLLISINIFLALLIICLKLVDVISHPIVIIRFQFDSQLGSDAQSPGVVVHMVPHEGGDHVVGVVVQRLHPQLARVVCSCCCGGKVLRFQLVVEEAVSCSLVNQDGWFGSGVGFHKFCGVICLACLHRSKISSKCLQKTQMINFFPFPDIIFKS